MGNGRNSQNSSNTQVRAYYRSITRNIVLIVLLVSLTPLFLITGIIGYYFETSYREQVLGQLRELVEKHEQSIDNFLNENLRDINFLAQCYTFEEISQDNFLQSILVKLQMVYGNVFVDLGIINKKGIQIAYAGPLGLKQADYSYSEWFSKAVDSKCFISDVFLGFRNQPHFIVSVKQKSGNEEWFLKATIDFAAFNAVVESVQKGKTGSAFIINRTGEYQTEPRSNPVLDKELLLGFFNGKAWVTGNDKKDELQDLSAENLVYQHQAAKTKIRIEEASYSGNEYIFVATPVKNGEWVFAYQQTVADAFPDLGKARMLAVSISLFGSLGIVLMALFLSDRMVRHIEAADEEKAKMNEQVIEAGKLASIGELAAGVAHEINNPVAVMVEEAGWIEDLLDDSELEEVEKLREIRRASQQIRTQGSRCREITHKLLSFARKTDTREDEVALNDVVEEVVGLSHSRARQAEISIVTNLSGERPTVSSSLSEMQQLLLNLINNAIDAFGTGSGLIEITTRIHISDAVIDVADSGDGIPPDILPNIFDPFFTTKPVGKGTGLGLSICYGIVKKLGGEITVHSVVGHGTTFHVHLPLSKSGGKGVHDAIAGS